MNTYECFRSVFLDFFLSLKRILSSSPTHTQIHTHTHLLCVFELSAEWKFQNDFQWLLRSENAFIHHSLFTLTKWRNWYWTTQKHEQYISFIFHVSHLFCSTFGDSVKEKANIILSESLFFDGDKFLAEQQQKNCQQILLVTNPHRTLWKSLLLLQHMTRCLFIPLQIDAITTWKKTGDFFSTIAIFRKNTETVLCKYLCLYCVLAAKNYPPLFIQFDVNWCFWREKNTKGASFENEKLNHENQFIFIKMTELSFHW